jgi:hypothetical protein
MSCQVSSRCEFSYTGSTLEEEEENSEWDWLLLLSSNADSRKQPLFLTAWKSFKESTAEIIESLYEAVFCSYEGLFSNLFPF